jgi:uncharacterized membrane protein
MFALHPFLVHFPIAMLTACFVFEVAGWYGKKPEWSQVGWWLQLVGTLGVVCAALSGVVAEASAGPALLRAADIFAWHEQLAFGTSAFFSFLIFFRFSSRRALPPGWPRLYLLALGAGVGLLLLTGWLGGELVFGYGIGMSSPSP